MKKSLIFTIIAMTLVVALVTPRNSAAADGKSSNLFADTTRRGNLSESGNPAVIRSRYVTLNLGVLGGSDGQLRTNDDVNAAFTLNLFPDATYQAVVDRVEQVSADGFSWIGHLEGVDLGQMILTVSNEVLTGVVVLPGGQYEIRYAGDNIYALSQVDTSIGAVKEIPVPKFKNSDVNFKLSPLSADSGALIDVMVVYTTDARVGAGGQAAIESLIDNYVSMLNTSFVNSDIVPRLRLVHKAEVSYTESGDSITDLERITAPADGYMDSVHSLRNTYKADLVVLVINMGICSATWQLESLSNLAQMSGYGFSVIQRLCSYVFFANGIGRNMAARPEWAVDSASGFPFTYNHEYVNLAQGWLTIMAKAPTCPTCTQLPYWSNPDKLYGGFPMGVPEGQPQAADNRKTLNNTAFFVANYRPENPPEAPSNLQASTISSTELHLSWTNNSDTGTDFHIERSPNGTSSWVEIGTTGSGVTYDDSGLACNTKYYYRVRVHREWDGVYSDYSNVANGTTSSCILPGAFNKSNPSNGATNQPTSLTISWGASSNATRYDYCYDTTNDNSCSNWTNNGTATSKALSGLANNTTYYWHVRAVNSNGTTYSNGSSTAFWAFTTQAAGSPPGSFNKSSPTNGATGQSISPTLTWGASSGATGYDYCYDTTNDGACSNWTGNGNVTSKTLSGLAYSTTYYWHIRANNAYGTTYSNGGYWSFTTQANNPGSGNYYQPFSTDVIGSGEWTASNASVTVNTSGGYLNIAADGANDAYAEKSFSYNLPVIVEVRMRLNPDGKGYYAPWLTIMTDTSNIGISYTFDLGWAFNGFTSITTKAPSVGNWITVKAFIRADGGELWAKYDGEANFTKVTSSTWDIAQITGIRFMQPWDSNCQMDYLRISKIVTKSFTSTSADDGWILESAENSGSGGTLNSSAVTLYVGDDAARKQYRAILSFATVTLPDNAVILSVKLKIRRQGVTGANPFTTHKPLLFDIRKPYIGTGAKLAAGDFQAAVQYSGGTFRAALVNGWYTATFKSAAYQYINKTGATQFRLRFKLDDDNDAVADILKLYSGNSTNSAYRPQLIVEYYLP